MVCFDIALFSKFIGLCGDPFVKSTLFECWNYLNSSVKNGQKICFEKTQLYPKKKGSTIDDIFDQLIRNSSSGQYNPACAKGMRQKTSKFDDRTLSFIN